MSTVQTKEAKEMIIEVAELTCRAMLKEAMDVVRDNCDDRDIDPTMILELVNKAFSPSTQSVEVFALMSRDSVVKLGYKDAYLAEMLRLKANHEKFKSDSDSL